MYLIDTNIVYWMRFGEKKLTQDILELLEDPAHDVFYSVIAPWELAIKQASGKLVLPKNFLETLPKMGFDCLPIDEKHIITLRELPKLHGDPFDRMLVAQAKAERMTLITGDVRLRDYPIKLLLVRPK